MTLTNFQPRKTLVTAAWLNFVDRIANTFNGVVSARFFGPDGFGTVAAYTAQVQAAADYAIANNKALYFEAGTHIINDITTNGKLRIYGDGAGITNICLRGTNHSWVANISNRYPDIFIAENLTFKTNGTSGIGLLVTSVYVSGGYADRDERKVFLNNVEFVGENVLANGWTTQCKIVNVNGGLYTNLQFRGRGTTDTQDEASHTISPTGIDINSTNNTSLLGGDHRLVNCTWYAINNCVIGGGVMEGITIDTAVAVNVGMLLDWTPIAPWGGRPGCKVINAHVNSYRGVAKITAVQQFQFEGGEVYHNVGATSNWIGYDIEDCTDGVITSNQYYNTLAINSTPTNTAIQISGPASRNIMIDNENFGGGNSGAYSGPTLDIAIDMSTVNPNAVTIGKNNKWGYQTSGTITGSITGTVLTVTAFGTGMLQIGAYLFGTGITPGTRIVNQLTGGPFSTGTYTVSASSAATGSITITATIGAFRIADIVKPANQQVYGTRKYSCRLSGNQTFATSATNTILFDGPVSDSIGVYLQSGVITLPYGQNIQSVRVTVKALWNKLRVDTITATNGRQLVLLKNGAEVTRNNANYYQFDHTSQEMNFTFDVAGGDRISVTGFQNSGNDLQMFGSGFTEISIEVLS